MNRIRSVLTRPYMNAWKRNRTADGTYLSIFQRQFIPEPECGYREIISRVCASRADFPKPGSSAIDQALEERMQLAQDISSLVLSLRKKVNIKVRQPLQRILIPVTERQDDKPDRNGGRPDQNRSECKGDRIPRWTINGFIKKKIKPNLWHWERNWDRR